MKAKKGRGGKGAALAKAKTTMGRKDSKSVSKKREEEAAKRAKEQQEQQELEE
jgi:hypothetical protein